VIALTLNDKNRSSDHWKNKTSKTIKDIVVFFGQGKVLYSSVFIYFLLSYYSIQNFYTLTLFIFWFFILSLNPKKIHSNFNYPVIKEKQSQIGEIFCVLSKKVFIAKAFQDKNDVRKFDLVKFNYSMQQEENSCISGIVLDTYLLNQEKWVKILQLANKPCKDEIFTQNVVYKISKAADVKKSNEEMRVDELVGIVVEGSTIEKIKFEYSKRIDDLEYGDILELVYSGKRLFYQVLSGMTKKEKLENRNEAGFVEGEAIQLGEWQNDTLSFRKFGWVPSINTPIFKSNTSDIVTPSVKYPEYILGKIPNTTLPSVINISDAISHHMALLGITGAGKTFIAREIVEKLLANGSRVLCMDFTGEWNKKIDRKLLYKNMLDTEESVKLFLEDSLGNGKLGIIELPELSNSVAIIENTQKMLSAVFDFAKKAYDDDKPQNICLVLEEAHTIVPESSFLGVNNWDSRAIVNKIGQIALQGRKFGVGLLVIAQRTAIVSKTVLTQCNTVICFQAFDDTSFKFLGNYVGKDIVETLPNLKQYHAIVAGKAIKSNLPMIIDLTRS